MPFCFVLGSCGVCARGTGYRTKTASPLLLDYGTCTQLKLARMAFLPASFPRLGVRTAIKGSAKAFTTSVYNLSVVNMTLSDWFTGKPTGKLPFWRFPILMHTDPPSNQKAAYLQVDTT